MRLNVMMRKMFMMIKRTIQRKDVSSRLISDQYNGCINKAFQIIERVQSILAF